VGLIEKFFPTRIKQMEMWEQQRKLGFKGHLKQSFRGWGLLYLIFLSIFPAVAFSGATLRSFIFAFFGFLIFWSLSAILFGALQWYSNEREYRDYERLKRS
jgi:hypothetical protein